MTQTETEIVEGIGSDYAIKYGFSVTEDYFFKSGRGVSHELVDAISSHKNEPDWMRKFRHKSLDYFYARPIPLWAADGKLVDIDFDDIFYYIKPTENQANSWEDLPAEIKDTWDKLGIPEAEKKYLAGVGAQYESEVVYHKLQEDLEKKGVLFLDTDTALREHEEMFKQYFGTIIPQNDNKFAALNSAVWSGGSFIYVPPGVSIDMPLQAYFRINAENMGQFERTLIIVDEGAYVHYVEGCGLAGSMVRVRDGEKPIEEIEVGDEVLTHRGRFRSVRDTMQRRFEGPIFRITFAGEGYRSLAVTPRHPLLVSTRSRASDHDTTFEPEWKEAWELKKGDYLAVPASIEVDDTSLMLGEEIVVGRGRHTAVAERVEVGLSPLMCRVMGLYVAEGTVSKNTSYLTFDSATHEEGARDLVRFALEEAFGIEPWEHEYEGRRGRSLRFSSVRAARFFAQTFGRTTPELRIPDWLFGLPDDHRAWFVRGLYDGEGSFDTKQDLYRINQTNREVAQRLRELLLSLGIRASLSCSERPAPRRPMWQIAVCKADNHLFEERILGLEPGEPRARKADVVIADGYCWLPIRSIDETQANCTVYNLSVEDDESYVMEGVASHNCTAPIYSTDSLHSAVVEIVVKDGGRCRYTTIQNWSNNVYNLVTKRAVAYKDATMEWVDGNLGSKTTVKYPAIWLLGERAHGEVLSIAFAGKGQHQDAGGKAVHVAPNTTSVITSKSISKNGGRAGYRGLLEVAKGAKGAKSKVVCDALILDEESRSDTYPYIKIEEDEVDIGHEATVSKIGEEQLFYLMSRGLSESEASAMIVSGFVEPITKELPLEYAVELNRLIQLQMEGSVG
ncbi:MAG: Fe-S cluster assembly protein SufB [Gaiellaceae bacterium]